MSNLRSITFASNLQPTSIQKIKENRKCFWYKTALTTSQTHNYASKKSGYRTLHQFSISFIHLSFFLLAKCPNNRGLWCPHNNKTTPRYKNQIGYEYNINEKKKTITIIKETTKCSFFRSDVDERSVYQKYWLLMRWLAKPVAERRRM